mgnify:CR=1 FL=1
MASGFQVNWVLIDEILVGKAPRKEKHLDLLKSKGIKSILSLCSSEEVEFVNNLKNHFFWDQIILPDHSYERTISDVELNIALEKLLNLKEKGPVFVHCVAAVERSPLVCMAWLVKHKKMKPSVAMNYLMQVNPGTNPLPNQLNILEKILN